MFGVKYRVQFENILTTSYKRHCDYRRGVTFDNVLESELDDGGRGESNQTTVVSRTDFGGVSVVVLRSS